MADFCTHWFRLAHDALPPVGHADAAVHVNIVNWEKCSADALGGSFGTPGSTLVPSVGEGVPPSRTFHTATNANTSAESDALESSFRRDAETNTRDACATRTCRLAFQCGDGVGSP